MRTIRGSTDHLIPRRPEKGASSPPRREIRRELLRIINCSDEIEEPKIRYRSGMNRQSAVRSSRRKCKVGQDEGMLLPKNNRIKLIIASRVLVKTSYTFEHTNTFTTIEEHFFFYVSTRHTNEHFTSCSPPSRKRSLFDGKGVIHPCYFFKIPIPKFDCLLSSQGSRT